jgi:hypothetical protein
MIEKRDGNYYVRDLCSTLGTIVNGEPIGDHFRGDAGFGFPVSVRPAASFAEEAIMRTNEDAPDLEEGVTSKRDAKNPALMAGHGLQTSQGTAPMALLTR